MRIEYTFNAIYHISQVYIPTSAIDFLQTCSLPLYVRWIGRLVAFMAVASISGV